MIEARGEKRVAEEEADDEDWRAARASRNTTEAASSSQAPDASSPEHRPGIPAGPGEEADRLRAADGSGTGPEVEMSATDADKRNLESADVSDATPPKTQNISSVCFGIDSSDKLGELK